MNFDIDYNNDLFEEEQEEVSQEEEQEEVSQQEESEEVSQEEEQEEVSHEEESEEVSQLFSQDSFTTVDYSQDFLILENIGYFQLFFTGTLAIFFVLWLVYKFFKSFF